MRKILLLAILLLLVSCSSEPVEYHIDPQPYLSVSNFLKTETIWFQMWKNTEERPVFYSLLPQNGQERWAVEDGATYNMAFRIVEDIVAIEDGSYMKRSEKVSESKEMEILIEHRINGISIYRDKDQYMYVTRYWD